MRARPNEHSQRTGFLTLATEGKVAKRSFVQIKKEKGKFGVNAMKRVASGAYPLTHWPFEPAKRTDDRADYCLYNCYWRKYDHINVLSSLTTYKTIITVLLIISLMFFYQRISFLLFFVFTVFLFVLVVFCCSSF